MASSSTRSLYPIQRNDGSDRLIDSVVSFRHDDGRYEIVRALTADERRQLVARRDGIAPHLATAKAAYIVDCVLEMMIGFVGAKSSAEDAKAVAAQYAAVLHGLPPWAIKRACLRWAMGQVAPDEVGEKALNRSFAPSAAQVRIIAEAIVRPHLQELVRINRTLEATVGVARSPQDREVTRSRIAAMHEGYKQHVAAREATRLAHETARIAELAKEKMAANAELVRREYQALGLPVPTPLVSLTSMKAMGWTVEQINGENVLVAPKRGA